ncbi:hypothetical protein FPCIR_12698 [Fusarium pseudocircinatum]|uniref:JmjC domain-containing protein n=1 Tax=Fusarium pseudocircinatum TaxID=56676 RepID=A0A8H5KL54_9HYPO|nr:hypothetical protein FPCIR_12698 [Fusarium pseudocircinatum]
MRRSVSAVKTALQRQSPQSQPLDQPAIQTESQEQNHSQIVPPVPTLADGLIQCYRSKAEDAILRMNAMLNARRNAKSDACESEDYKSLHKYCTGVSVGRTMSASEYLELGRDDRPQDSIVEHGPAVNFLNLKGTKDHAGPECITNMYDYKCIELSSADNGKTEAEAPVGDLDDLTRFQLLATTGAIHLPHVDRHGVLATVLTEQGEKIWLVWPNLGLDVLRGWDEENELPTPPIAIHIEECSYLIQPPSTLHAPVTMKTCLMTGTMHWYPGHLPGIIQATYMINEDAKITNEDVSDQFIPEMAKLLGLWRENQAPC